MDEEDEHFLSASHRKCILLSGTECHRINYLLTELARAVPGNIGPRSSRSVSKRLIIYPQNINDVIFRAKNIHYDYPPLNTTTIA